MPRKRINLMLDNGTILKLDQLVKESRRIYGNNGVSKSRIVDDLVDKIEPPKVRIKALMKKKQQELMQLKDDLEFYEAKEKK